MSPPIEQSETTSATSPDEMLRVEVQVEEAGPLAKISPPEKPADQWQQILDQFLVTLSELPDYVTSFFSQYQRPILTIGLFVAALVTLKVTLAAVDAVNDVPLLSPLFELIGIGYSSWFVYRYLLKASTRQELSQEIKAVTDQIVGKNSSSI